MWLRLPLIQPPRQRPGSNVVGLVTAADQRDLYGGAGRRPVYKNGGIVDYGHPHVGMGLEAEGEDRNDDEKYGQR